MPQIDFSLKDLQSYTGINPLPDDFDAYWNDALNELDELGISYEKEKAEFSAPKINCFNLYFKGVGNARVHAKFLEPETSGNGAGICMYHGYSGDSGGWLEKLPYAYAGFKVLALDVRGQMGLSQDSGAYLGNTLRGHIIRGLWDEDPKALFFRNVFLDCAQCVKILMSMSEIDEKRIGVMGGSQGGALAIVAAALEPRVARAVSVYPFLSDYKRVWEMDAAQRAYEELEYYIKRVDPRHEKINELWHKLGYIDVKNIASRIRAEVLMFISQMDVVCPPSTQFAVYNNIRSTKSYKLYPNHGHEHLPDSDEIIYDFMRGLL